MMHLQSRRRAAAAVPIIIVVGVIVMVIALFSVLKRSPDENRIYGITPEVWRKFDPGLKRAVEALNGDRTIELPVMLVLEAAATPTPGAAGPHGREERARLAEERRIAFEAESAQVIQQLGRMGARELGSFWINSTVTARATLPALQAAGDLRNVKQIVLTTQQKAIAT